MPTDETRSSEQRVKWGHQDFFHRHIQTVSGVQLSWYPMVWWALPENKAAVAWSWTIRVRRTVTHLRLHASSLYGRVRWRKSYVTFMQWRMWDVRVEPDRKLTVWEVPASRPTNIPICAAVYPTGQKCSPAQLWGNFLAMLRISSKLVVKFGILPKYSNNSDDSFYTAFIRHSWHS